MNIVCAQCGEKFDAANSRGRTPKYCSGACRTAACRARRRVECPIPAGMREASRWVRCDAEKRPVRRSGGLLRWSEPSAWMSFEEAQGASWGVGAGFVLGGGVGVIDLDHCIGEDGELSSLASRVLEENPGAYVEVSQSGRGLHVFGRLPNVSVRRPGFEVYGGEAKRFVWVTGRLFRSGGLPDLVV